MSILKNKKVIVIGDRDGIPGEAISKCVESAGAEVVFSSTECFVWTAAGAMDLENQKRVKEFAEQYGSENVVVILGSSEGESAGLAAETVTFGDPTYAGPLAGVSLKLKVYHVCEPEIKQEFEESIYDDQVSMMEMVLDIDNICEEMNSIRRQF